MNELHSTQTLQTMPCNECPAGVMHPRRITYFTWLSEELITVPNFPARVCDLCGKREYDEHAVATLAMLLSPEAGKPTAASNAPLSLIPVNGISPTFRLNNNLLPEKK